MLCQWAGVPALFLCRGGRSLGDVLDSDALPCFKDDAPVLDVGDVDHADEAVVDDDLLRAALALPFHGVDVDAVDQLA